MLNPHNMTEALRARWKPQWDESQFAERPTKANARFGFLRSLRLAEDTYDQKMSLAKIDTFSEKGRVEAIRGFVKERIWSEMEHCAKRIDMDEKAALARRPSLASANISPTDAAGAVLRHEVRAWLRGMNQGDALKILMASDDPIILQAVTEAPAPLSGFAPKLLEETISHMTTAKYPEETADFEECMEAVHLARIGYNTAVTSIREAGAFESPKAFEVWLEAA